MARKTPPSAAAPDDGNPWPARLKALRERLGLTQKQAAARIKATDRSWGTWEKGTLKPAAPFQLLIELLERGLLDNLD